MKTISVSTLTHSWWVLPRGLIPDARSCSTPLVGRQEQSSSAPTPTCWSTGQKDVMLSNLVASPQTTVYPKEQIGTLVIGGEVADSVVTGSAVVGSAVAGSAVVVGTVEVGNNIC